MDRKFWANLALCVFLGGIFSVGVSSFGSALTPKGLYVKDPVPSAEAAPLLSKVQLVKYKLDGGPEHMVNAEFDVQNSSDQDVKNFNILCEFSDEHGAYLGKQKWLLSGTVPAGETMRHTSLSERFVHARTNSVTCRITDFKVAAAPFFVLHRVEGGHGSGDAEGHDPHGNDHGKAAH